MTEDVPGQIYIEDEASAWFETIAKTQSENERLAKENESLRKMLADESIIRRRREKEIRDLKATLDASQAHHGQWLV